MSSLVDRVSRSVREYDAQGWHRTGTRVDDESAEWLVGRVGELGERQFREFGHEVRMESFELERVVPGESYVEVDGRRVDGFPLFDGTFTDEVGISGRLGLAGSECDVALIEFQAAGGAADIQELRESGQYKAFVGVVTSGLGEGSATAPLPQFAHPLTALHSGHTGREDHVPSGIAIRNGEFFSSRGGAPVVQVSGVEFELMNAAAESGAEARVVAQAGVESTTAQNVIIEVAGSDSSLAPLVVMTPRSGWFGCAVERGGGIACWLEIMSSFSEKSPERDVIFIATSGHELGHLGLKSFLNSNAELREKAHAWLHLGASIGAALDWVPRLQTSDGEFERVALDCFTVDPGFADLVPLTIVRTGTTKSGEAMQINRFGGRFVSVIGNHALFHQESDQWPGAVDAEALAVYASALTRIAGRLSAV